MAKLRILYVTHEISPFLEISALAPFLNELSIAIQEKAGMEVRIVMPRFGVINERKNKLHEVVRLSGVGISMGNEDRPLAIKVASMPNSRFQVYFIDNEDFFQRKGVFENAHQELYEDNGERAIFFCKGALEMVRKLGWAPDIVHCSEWMTGLISLYLKTTYKNEPTYKNTKVVFSLFEEMVSQKLGNLKDKAKLLDVEDDHLKHLESGDYMGFNKIGITHADAITLEGESVAYEQIIKELEPNKYYTFEKNEEIWKKYAELYQNLSKS